MTEIIYILDTSALLSGKPLHFPNALLLIPSAVSDEIQHGGKDHQNLQLLKEQGLQTRNPSKKAIQTIQTTAKHTGDHTRLSTTDIHVLALAYDIQNQNNVTMILLTDDYAIQNIAHHLHLPYQGITQKGIKKPIKWKQICPACHTKIPKGQEDCPICGTIPRLSSEKNR